MIYTLMAFLTTLSISTMMVTLMTLLSKKAMLNSQKLTPFECGFNPMSYTRVPFSIHFFMIAMLFLIFDIEIIIIMPMILTFKFSLIKFWIMTSLMFTIILILGLYHEWKNGAISWVS
nr:NADH dehydrogenase subunit 3 [Paradorydium reflexanum]